VHGDISYVACCLALFVSLSARDKSAGRRRVAPPVALHMVRLVLFPSGADAIPRNGAAHYDPANGKVVFSAQRWWAIEDHFSMKGHFAVLQPKSNGNEGASTMQLDPNEITEVIKLSASHNTPLPSVPKAHQRSIKDKAAVGSWDVGALQLFVFAEGDAPLLQTGTGGLRYDTDADHVEFRAVKRNLFWRIIEQHEEAGRYAVLDETTKLVTAAPITRVSVLHREIGLDMTPARAVVSNDDLFSCDFQSKKGKKMERQRLEFGRTTMGAAKPTAMNRAEIMEKVVERAKRQRDQVAREVEAQAEAGTLEREPMVLAAKSTDKRRGGKH
jgi:hypothetical protein